MRAAIAELPGSKIREVANAALGRSDVLPFWFGESDEPTPAFIRDAAIHSLNDGETFYAHNLGLPELREALSAYVSGLHGPVGPDRIAVTSSGVNALMLAMQALAGPGDEVVAVVPLWPNLTAQPAILGARVRRVSLTVSGGAWQLDMERLLAAVTPTTTVLLLNAPNNPTGWTLTRAEQQTILAHCRRTGTWIVADEVYERVFFDGPIAAEPPQGGRTPPRGAGAAGDVATPHGGMYAFFRIDGHDDSLALAKRLVTEAGLGLAPGAAFGIEAEGWLRWCFASHDPARLSLGVERLRRFLGL